MPQVLLGWKYGDCVDEKAKIHPQLRSYKSLTEKVQNVKCKIFFFFFFFCRGLSSKRHVTSLISLSILVSVLQEKEIYRWPIRESLKSMLAMGWSIDRTKDGESMSQQRESEKMRKISQASQVQSKATIVMSTCTWVFLKTHFPASPLQDKKIPIHTDGIFK